jgi:hypothetical protein
VDLLIRPTPASEIRLRKTVELTNQDMFGDPYNFIINSTQSKTFSIATVEGVIEGIELSLFQNDDFVDAKLGTINNKIEELKEVSHIFVTNIEVALGAALNSIPDNSV